MLTDVGAQIEYPLAVPTIGCVAEHLEDLSGGGFIDLDLTPYSRIDPIGMYDRCTQPIGQSAQVILITKVATRLEEVDEGLVHRQRRDDDRGRMRDDAISSVHQLV